jgi:hypothetical protein
VPKGSWAMKRILVIEDNEKYVKVLDKALHSNSSSSLRIITTSSVLHSIEYLKQISAVDLVIVKNRIDNQATASEMAAYMIREGRAIPMIVLGPVDCNLPAICSVVADPYTNWKDVVGGADKFLQSAPTINRNKDGGKYSRIPLPYLCNTDKLSCDLYLKIRNKDNKYDYLKRISEGENILGGDIKEFQRMGLNSFYLDDKVRRLFINKTINETANKMEDANSNITDLLGNLEIAYHLITVEVCRFGFIDNLTDLLGPMIQYLERIITHEKLRTQFVKILLAMDSSDTFKQAALTHFACAAMVNASEWGNASQLEKLSHVSYMHDLALENDLQLTSITEDQQLTETIESKSKRDLVHQHAALSSMVAQQYSKLPFGVARIIREHHGSPTGEGFMLALDENISALAIVFIVAEKFSLELLDCHDPCVETDRDQLFQQLYDYFPQKAAQNLVHNLNENITI